MIMEHMTCPEPTLSSSATVILINFYSSTSNVITPILRTRKVRLTGVKKLAQGCTVRGSAAEVQSSHRSQRHCDLTERQWLEGKAFQA